jgi:protein-S-isoprenylcysteine O-methyltransferase Ste14
VTPYQRFFGAAPIGWALTLALFWVAVRLEPVVSLPAIHGNPALGFWTLLLAAVLSGALAMWTHFSLPPLSRGKRLVTTGAFKYLRHPIYTSFLILFLGIAAWLDNWIYLIWALAQFPVWHFSLLGEERLMCQDFPGAYEAYCRNTRRFIPGIW